MTTLHAASILPRRLATHWPSARHCGTTCCAKRSFVSRASGWDPSAGVSWPRFSSDLSSVTPGLSSLSTRRGGQPKCLGECGNLVEEARKTIR
jgi:hypothetical protein